ncbi:MAG: acetyl-CoA hydrolase/transferase C-terminal domain-containing protein [Thermomicrobiales bacterium]
MGSQDLYDYVDDNPFVEFHPSDIATSMFEIAQQHAMVAINSAIEVDLTGAGRRRLDWRPPQSTAASAARWISSGAPSSRRAARRSSRCPRPPRRPVIEDRGLTCGRAPGWWTTRGHVEHIATEYGIFDLRGRTLRQRADALINLAHPDFGPTSAQPPSSGSCFRLPDRSRLSIEEGLCLADQPVDVGDQILCLGNGLAMTFSDP